MTTLELISRCERAGLKLTATARGIRAAGPTSAMNEFEGELDARQLDIRAILREWSEPEAIQALRDAQQ